MNRDGRSNAKRRKTLVSRPPVQRFLTDPSSQASSQQPEYGNATRSIEPDLLVTVALCSFER